MSKGQKKPSLRDLSRISELDSHIQDLLHELDHQSDRGAALIAATMVDVALSRLMRCRIVHFKDCDEILFWKEGAPLGTFSARIKVAKAFGVIGQLTEHHCNAIRNIRNQFAHSPLKIDLTHKLFASEISKLIPDAPDWKPEWTTERRRFIGTAVKLAEAFERSVHEHAEDIITVWLK